MHKENHGKHRNSLQVSIWCFPNAGLCRKVLIIMFSWCGTLLQGAEHHVFLMQDFAARCRASCFPDVGLCRKVPSIMFSWCGTLPQGAEHHVFLMWDFAARCRASCYLNAGLCRKVPSIMFSWCVYSVCRMVNLARDYATRRRAFGNLLKDYPLHVRTLAEMEVGGKRMFSFLH